MRASSAPFTTLSVTFARRGAVGSAAVRAVALSLVTRTPTTGDTAKAGTVLTPFARLTTGADGSFAETSSVYGSYALDVSPPAGSPLKAVRTYAEAWTPGDAFQLQVTLGGSSGAGTSPSASAPRDTSTRSADASDTTAVPGAVWAPGAPGADTVGGLGHVAGATVRALRGTQEIARLTTAGDGSFTFRALPGGLYAFEVAAPAGSPLLPTRMEAVTVTHGQFGVMTTPGTSGAPSTLHPYRALNVILYPFATR